MFTLKMKGHGPNSTQSCVRLCLQKPLVVVMLLLVAFSILCIEATPQFAADESEIDADFMETPDKRPARLSYFRSPYSQSRGRYRMPWDNLPNTNCLRKYCRSDSDCCKRYSKCNTLAHVCYDCWYGFPCSSNRDCCHKFPYCDPVRNTCVK